MFVVQNFLNPNFRFKSYPRIFLSLDLKIAEDRWSLFTSVSFTMYCNASSRIARDTNLGELSKWNRNLNLELFRLAVSQ